MYQLIQIKGYSEIILSTGSFLEMQILKKQMFSKVMGKLIIRVIEK